MEMLLGNRWLQKEALGLKLYPIKENNSHAKLLTKKKWPLSGRHSDYRQSMAFTEK